MPKGDYQGYVRAGSVWHDKPRPVGGGYRGEARPVVASFPDWVAGPSSCRVRSRSWLVRTPHGMVKVYGYQVVGA
jgi:hypothetical protein